jgi:hypothetical protein
VSAGVTVPRLLPGVRSQSMAPAPMSSSPLSPLMGRAPSLTSFIPLWSMGLWLAVTMMPPSRPRAKVAWYTISVPHWPMSSTSAPASVRPRVSAVASEALLSRQSRPTATVRAFR